MPDQSTRDTTDLARGIVAECLGMDARMVKVGDSLNTLGMDSLDRFDLVMRLEDALGTDITDDELAEVRTVSDLVEWIEGRP